MNLAPRPIPPGSTPTNYKAKNYHGVSYHQRGHQLINSSMNQEYIYTQQTYFCHGF